MLEIFPSSLRSYPLWNGSKSSGFKARCKPPNGTAAPRCLLPPLLWCETMDESDQGICSSSSLRQNYHWTKTVRTHSRILLFTDGTFSQTFHIINCGHLPITFHIYSSFQFNTSFLTKSLENESYLDDIHSEDRGKVAQAERQAINSVIQGSAADLMKLAMIKMSARIMDWKKEVDAGDGKDRVPPKILLQIHDELLFEVMANEFDILQLRKAVLRCCADDCAREFNMQVPLKLKCSYGGTWGNMTEI